MKAKLGPAGATTATAHKIAIIFYTMVKNQVEYDASLWAQRDAMRAKRLDPGFKSRPRSEATNLCLWSVPPNSLKILASRRGS